jgi:hypothetical protein
MSNSNCKLCCVAMVAVIWELSLRSSLQPGFFAVPHLLRGYIYRALSWGALYAMASYGLQRRRLAWLCFLSATALVVMLTRDLDTMEDPSSYLNGRGDVEASVGGQKARAGHILLDVGMGLWLNHETGSQPPAGACREHRPAVKNPSRNLSAPSGCSWFSAEASGPLKKKQN